MNKSKVEKCVVAATNRAMKRVYNLSSSGARLQAEGVSCGALYDLYRETLALWPDALGMVNCSYDDGELVRYLSNECWSVPYVRTVLARAALKMPILQPTGNPIDNFKIAKDLCGTERDYLRLSGGVR